MFSTAQGPWIHRTRDGSKDVLVHATAPERGIRSLNKGDRVTFVLEGDRKGRGKIEMA